MEPLTKEELILLCTMVQRELDANCDCKFCTARVKEYKPILDKLMAMREIRPAPAEKSSV